MSSAWPQSSRASRLRWRRRDGAVGRPQQPEPPVQPGQDLRRREHDHAGRRQLDGEGQAVEPAADLGDDRLVRRGQRLIGCAGSSTIGEQPHGRLADPQRLDPPAVLGGQVEWDAAGGQHADIGAADEDAVDEVGGGAHDVLAVVEDEQRSALRQLGQQVGFVDVAGGIAGRRGDRCDHLTLVGHDREVDEPHAVGPRRCQPAADLRGEAGLAHPARADDGDDDPWPHHALEGVDVVGSPDERRQGGKEVVTVSRHGPHRDRRGRVGVDAHDGRQPDRAFEVAQAERTERLDAHSGTLARCSNSILRREDVSTVGGTDDACRLVQRQRDVVAIAGVGETAVHTDADPHDRVGRPRLAPDRPLCPDGRGKASAADSKATMKASPTVLTSAPRCADHTARSSSLWASSTGR